MAAEGARQGYFHALTSSCFKTDREGRTLFFPWGVLGHGYVISSEQRYKRLRQWIKIYLTVSMVLIIGTMVAWTHLGGFIITVLCIIFYLAWLPYLLRGLERTAERLSLQESMASQARGHSAVGLWLLEIGSLAFVVAGIFILVTDPNQWMIALASIGFFGLCAAAITGMLVLRWRGAPSADMPPH